MKLEKVEMNLIKNAVKAAAIRPILTVLSTKDKMRLCSIETVLINRYGVYNAAGELHINSFVNIVLESVDGFDNCMFLVDGFWSSKENCFHFTSKDEYEKDGMTTFVYPKRVDYPSLPYRLDDESDDYYHVLIYYPSYGAEESVFQTRKEAVDYINKHVKKCIFSSPRMKNNIIVTAKDEFCYYVKQRNRIVYLTDYYKIPQRKNLENKIKFINHFTKSFW